MTPSPAANISNEPPPDIVVGRVAVDDLKEIAKLIDYSIGATTWEPTK